LIDASPGEDHLTVTGSRLPMSWPKRRRWWLASLLGLVAISPESISGQQKTIEWTPVTSLSDPRLDVIRRAAPLWETRSGPVREVVDQVCLVPDLPTFFQAISSWDEGHYFPILIDDVESSFRFIRAFKPARIVRMPKSVTPIPEGQTWERAVEAVGASWSNEVTPGTDRPRGDAVPRTLGSTPPGVVFSSPDAPMLAGAVALAAGRFQPMIRLDFAKKFADVLSLADANGFAETLTEKLKERVANFAAINDDCDFLTVAGDWPYSYRGEDGQQNAVDDRIGRQANPQHRWAWAGRLLGDSKESVYRAMCSLFLQPESALMFNGYEESSPPWSTYSMKVAAARLNTFVRTSQISGEKEANVEGWHEAFDPINRYGLVLINSHGESAVFHLRGGSASTSDVPFSVPSAVLMIHSHSADNPTDPDTIAGRWLANGAFLYFGSMNEPYLQSFRLPRLVGEMIGERLPFAVAVRSTMNEFGGQPWRLAFLGDPLYRIKLSSEAKAPRLASWNPTASWTTYAEPARASNGSDVEMFLWTFKTALARLQGKPAKGTGGDDLIEALLAINRAKLPVDFKPIFDGLLVDVLLQARKRSALKSRLTLIPDAERTPAVKRTLETLLAIDLNYAVGRKDASAARTAWRDLMKFDGARALKGQATTRVGQLADTPIRRHDWIALLRAALRDRPRSPEAESITAELKRVEEASKNDH
jgi:hypothetical protein